MAATRLTSSSARCSRQSGLRQRLRHPRQPRIHNTRWIGRQQRRHNRHPPQPWNGLLSRQHYRQRRLHPPRPQKRRCLGPRMQLELRVVAVQTTTRHSPPACSLGLAGHPSSSLEAAAAAARQRRPTGGSPAAAAQYHAAAVAYQPCPAVVGASQLCPAVAAPTLAQQRQQGSQRGGGAGARGKQSLRWAVAGCPCRQVASCQWAGLLLRLPAADSSRRSSSVAGASSSSCKASP